MREIIFKAKRVDNGEWVEGDLVINKPTNSYRIITHFGLCIDGKYAGNNLHHISGEIYLVAPETVCQFTGLKDKNGNKIFEGDTTKAGNLECTIRYKGHEFVAEWQCKRGEKRSPAMVFRQHEITGNIHD